MISFANGRKAKAIFGVIIFFCIIFIRQFYFIVNPGEVGIIVRLGTIKPTAFSQWFYLKFPFIDQVRYMDVKTQIAQKREVAAASKDLQTVRCDVAVNYHIDKTKVINLWQTVWPLYVIQNNIIEPAIQESIKAATAQFTAEQMITKRQEVSDTMEKILKEKLEKIGIIVEALNIVNFQFSAEFDKAIENKVKAEQEALAEKNILEKYKYQAQQKIEQARWESEAALIKAKAEAEAIRIKTDAIRQQGGKEYVQLKRIEQWDGKLPQTVLWDSPIMIDLRKN